MGNIFENLSDDNSAINNLYDEAVAASPPTFLESSVQILNSKENRYEHTDEIGHGGAKKSCESMINMLEDM